MNVKLTLDKVDAEMVVRALNWCAERAEIAGKTEYSVDKLCREECKLQWRRIAESITEQIT